MSERLTHQLASSCPLILVLALMAPLPAAGGAGEGEAEPLVGTPTREEVEAAEPEWVAAEVAAEIDARAAQALSRVEPGAEVVVYFGTWCSDSKRELARFWRALDETGSAVPFPIRYVAVSRSKEEPAAEVAGADLLFVPTFVVRRDGAEVGRIVEQAPTGIEVDLLALLRGEASGVLTGSQPQLMEAEGAPLP